MWYTKNRAHPPKVTQTLRHSPLRMYSLRYKMRHRMRTVADSPKRPFARPLSTPPK